MLALNFFSHSLWSDVKAHFTHQGGFVIPTMILIVSELCIACVMMFVSM